MTTTAATTMKRSAVAELQATVLIVIMTLSLSYVVYSHFRAARPALSPTFFNSPTLLGGSSPPILLVRVNSSVPVSLESVEVDGVSSSPGRVIAFDGASYSTSGALCEPGHVTVFSAYASSPGPLTVSTDGASWISGYRASSLDVSVGWHEVMISGGSACSVSLPDGTNHASLDTALLSPLPHEGALNSSRFLFYLPWSADGAGHTVLFVFRQGVDTFED